MEARVAHDEFWTRAAEELRTYDLLKHPFYQAWSAGELTSAELGFYGRQYLEHVAAFPTYLTALHSRLPEGRTRSAVLRNAAEEEVKGRPHADLWRQFVTGIDPEGPAHAQEILPEVCELVDTYRDFGQSAPPATALGAFYAYESQVPRIAAEKRAGLKKFCGANDATCAYFTLHMTADVHHAKVWRGLIEQTIDERGDAAASEVLGGMRQGARALWRALDGIEAARQKTRIAQGEPQPDC
jgi:pyrroloquinoline-quinone synthase